MESAAAASADATPSDASESLDTSETLENESLEETSGEGDGKPTRDSSGKFQSGKGAPAKKAEDDDHEEVAIGRVKARLPKDVAKAVKDLERGARENLNHAAQERKKAAEILRLAKDDPDKFFELTGIDADTFAESRLARKYELQAMTKDERELYEYRQQKAAAEKAELQTKEELIGEIEKVVGSKAPEKLKGLSKERLQEILQIEQKKAGDEQNQLQTEFVEALKSSGLPKHKVLVQWVAATMRNHLVAKKESLQAKDAAAIVKQEVFSAVPEMLSAMDPEGILQVLGPQITEKVRAHLIARATGRVPPSQPTKDSKGPGNPAPQKKSKVMNEFEYREYLKSLRSELTD